ncbi:alpha/beta fold hydrolase [Microlunatus flavus]|uniref:Pimeloyl-ACP methyl ester carboxylesterase n=1 Tax=Microlunatus flavus TaxID=1036181 RepID=A0A1H9JAK1_9ACTN|nr:alpha/beta hydrolase [Microlunatus flavus]SEQ83625.1 Pimeloyl-ACP methyl ester carboxylesterase [Microlunatus flavus]
MTTSSPTTQVPTVTRTVGEGEDLITYDVRGDLADATPARPVLVMFGSPMDAGGFGPLAARFTDRPVVTYDPRGTGRNPKGTTPVTPEQHAEDLHRVITALEAGPVDLMGSSGGAVNALALAAAHPEDVRRVVAHEPPTAMGLPDQDVLLDACADLAATYASSGQGPAMAKFMALVMHDGPLPDDWLARPAPDPAAFGLPTEDDGDRTQALFRNGPACNALAVDPARLGPLGDRVVIAVGVESGDTMAARGGRQVARTLGLAVTDFPSHHGGFLGDEFGQHGDPDGFAARLHAVLDR